MAYIHDLIDLIKNANDIYLVSPSNNVRSAYIQIDDLCELTMKSWLQSNTKYNHKSCIEDLEKLGLLKNPTHTNSFQKFIRNEVDQTQLENSLGIGRDESKKKQLDGVLSKYRSFFTWSPEYSAGQFKSFYNIVDEIKARKPFEQNNELYHILKNILDRRTHRNNFFHNQDQMGLTVDQNKCLDAFLDLYALNSLLFEDEFEQTIEGDYVFLAQMAVINLKRISSEMEYANRLYQDFLINYGSIKLDPNTLGHEFCLIYQDSYTFLDKLKDKFNTEKIAQQNEIDRINDLKKKNKHHIACIKQAGKQIERIERLIDRCFVQ
ncbi:hypothetical protein [Methanosarcina sp. WWM596]|uniref:hypothetical protein n=1 Tax=Methanosarcina sp. WWM596 TaxID=1434103 RepID=UPI000615AD3F|nr:hypothetical protein [Methanosarcina sp. WWM596]AKB19529.1 hypothetical protein MSWHS_2666 [Methanosarcina sp. WWM596]